MSGVEIEGDCIVGQIKSVIVMVLVQIAIAGMNVLYKLAANDGIMSLRVMIVAYRFIFATAFLLPLALLGNLLSYSLLCL